MSPPCDEATSWLSAATFFLACVLHTNHWLELSNDGKENKTCFQEYLFIQQEVHCGERSIREDSGIVSLIQPPQAFLLDNRAEGIDASLVRTLESVRLHLQSFLHYIHRYKDGTAA